MFVNCKFRHVLQVGLAQMLKGGVIMDVTNVEEARIAEEAGAVAVMALERVPAGVALSLCCALPHPFLQDALVVVAEVRHCSPQDPHRIRCFATNGRHIVANALWPSLTGGQQGRQALVPAGRRNDSGSRH